MNIDLTTNRTLSLYGFALSAIAVGGILFFWTIGAILLVANNGGTIVQMRLDQVWYTLYMAYPIVAIVALVGGAIAWFLRRDLAAVAIASSPIVLTVAYYFLLTLVPRT